VGDAAPTPAKPWRRLALPAGLVALGAGLVVLLAGSDPGPRPVPSSEGAPRESRGEPGLAGAGEAREGSRETGEGPARGTSAVTEVRGGNPTALALAPIDEAAALAPDGIEDLVRAGARPALEVFRSALVGALRPYGHRDGPEGFAPRFTGVARVARDDLAATEAIDDTLDPVSTAVLGRVRLPDGTAVRGAEVILYSTFYLRQAYYDRRVREIGRTRTDADGRFDLRPVDLDTVHFGRSGEVLVTVRDAFLPDLVAQRLEGLVPGKESEVGDLVLSPVGAVVTGTILDFGGKPVVGAVVRASGVVTPVDYDKTERMVVLSACPSATTDAEGRYRLEDFAPGRHEISVHVNLDCVIHVADQWEGVREFSPRVRSGHGVIGRVVDEWGEPVAVAVVRGGGNWTPSNPDGTFWLDNTDPGPLVLDVSHHAFARHLFPEVATGCEQPVVLPLTRRLARVTVEVVDGAGAPVPLVDVEWVWAEGRGPDEFTPRSPRWHDPRGTFALVIPDGVIGVRVASVASGFGALAETDLVDGARVRLVLEAPPPLPSNPDPEFR
jgi:hypothetical protein